MFQNCPIGCLKSALWGCPKTVLLGAPNLPHWVPQTCPVWGSQTSPIVCPKLSLLDAPNLPHVGVPNLPYGGAPNLSHWVSQICPTGCPKSPTARIPELESPGVRGDGCQDVLSPGLVWELRSSWDDTPDTPNPRESLSPHSPCLHCQEITMGLHRTPLWPH